MGNGMKTNAHQKYKNKAGQIVPGVTTAINLLAKPQLLQWAWQMGMDGKDFHKVRDQAASIGTIAHYLITCELKKEKPDLSEYSPSDVAKAETSLLSFLEWVKNEELETVAVEIPLVSERDQFGGTIDWIAKSKKNNKLRLIDFKTGKAIYEEAKYQIGAYEQLWNENNPDNVIDECCILRLDKEDGRFDFSTFPNLEVEFQIFLHLLGVYKLRLRH